MSDDSPFAARSALVYQWLHLYILHCTRVVVTDHSFYSTTLCDDCSRPAGPEIYDRRLTATMWPRNRLGSYWACAGPHIAIHAIIFALVSVNRKWMYVHISWLGEDSCIIRLLFKKNRATIGTWIQSRAKLAKTNGHIVAVTLVRSTKINKS